jgi:hypothetical protein
VRTITFQWPEQSLRFALSDLGLRRLYRSRLAGPISVERFKDGNAVRYPRPTTRLAIKGTARLYDAAKVGQLVLAVGRRPER